MQYEVFLKEEAKAKINLFLDVVSKREDGFHDIKSVMQSISLCDYITMSINRSGNDILKSDCHDIPTDEKNLAIKAVNAFRKEFSLDFGTNIYIEKHIPASAGMAGGSSDAAAVLRILKKLTQINASEERMLRVAEAIGADVPFCYIGGTMLAEGKGEALSVLPKCPLLHLAVAIKGDSVSTPYAYAMLDEKFEDFSENRDGDKYCLLISALNKQDLCGIGDNLFNVFESVTEPSRPEILKLKRIMSDFGASSVLMSGSGPSVFGIFPGEEQAEKAIVALTEYGADAYYCTT